ncbi:MAG TPA: tRNA 5-hydroxyuridine modification protein YegQ [Pirellulaceae bacterium]|jgi:putative protease|nr:tRNA 5-hydroxyuridine modification protein YegQ [Pirellulaceae bacterium]
MRPELLSPAGTRKAMRYAFAYGADAVYAGQPRYSLRVRENEFNKLDVMADAVAEAHRLGKKFYIASNIAPHNAKVRSYMQNMQPIIEMTPDALIMSDPGLIMMVRQHWPDVPIHLSVQANAVNFATVRFWQSQGLTRVILSRELSIPEIAEIQQECPEIELEVFVHGALCIAYSGRCLLSGYLNHRDSNQGACTNSCRWNYEVSEAVQTPEGDVRLKVLGDPQIASAGCDDSTDSALDKRMFVLEEKERPGELMPAFEDEHGTYIMNSRDLRAVEHVEQFVAMGLSSLKIEGRTKTHFYVARTAQVYRRAIDDAVQGRSLDSDAMRSLDSLSNRGYTDGFYSRRPISELQNYESGTSVSHQQQFVGELIQRDGTELIVAVKNRFSVGDELELMTPTRNTSFSLAELHSRTGEAIDVAPGSGYVVRLRIPEELLESMSDHDVEFGLLMRSIA